MAEVLFLAHRLPYPPDKGDKIRSWQILRHLTERHRVHLGTFYDDPADAAHVPVLRDICADVCALPLDPRQARLRSLAALATGEAMSARYYRDARLAAWIAGAMDRTAFDAAFVYCSAMAPYVSGLEFPRRVIDMVDVDSEKWRQYAETGAWPMSMLHAREGRRLLALERRAAATFDATLFVSSAEAALFTRRAPEAASCVHAMENGVELERFAPGVAHADPFPQDRRALVFTGAMDYRPNIDAVCWFASQVMPALRACWPALDFWVVGSNPAAAVQRLAEIPNIRVTGRVPDVRPYLAHAGASVAPLRIARGIQNKVLEAMAMGLPVIASPEALTAFAFKRGAEILAASTPEDFIEQVALALSPAGRTIGARARARVEADFRWDDKLAVIDALLGDEQTVLAAAS